MTQLCGAVEAGGTKFVCAVGRGPDEVLALERIPTSTPEETVAQVVGFFRSQEVPHGKLAAIGVGSFGPLDPNPSSPTYGYITSTPKPGWQNTDLAGPLRQALDTPVAFDTDVNAAALGEGRWGAAQSLDCFIYLTVGTGIGGGAMVGGQLLHGLVHPEMGHVRVPHDRSRDPYEGACPFHGDCLEGLAAGPAIENRWGEPAEQLPREHEAWRLESEYLAWACVNYICTLSPERIILGGGVMSQSFLYPMIRENVLKYLNDYIDAPAIKQSIDQFIVAPGLGDRAGVLGALALGQQLLN